LFTALGPRIRALRQARGLRLADLARACGLSPSFISQVERSLTRPSLDALWQIADRLGVRPSELLEPMPSEPPSLGAQIIPKNGAHADAESRIVRREERKRIQWARSVAFELLTPDLRRNVEFAWGRMEPGAVSTTRAFSHGGEEYAVVIRGQLTYVVGDEEFVLNEGDSIAVACATPHYMVNRSDDVTEVIAVISPPTF
jgi:transcriptional regulator with XRE-family HTH domain